MKFRDLDLKLGSKLLWNNKGVKPNQIHSLSSSPSSVWIGEVTDITGVHFSITWCHVLNGWEQTVRYHMDSTIFKQIVYDGTEFIEYLNLFKRRQSLS